MVKNRKRDRWDSSSDEEDCDQPTLRGSSPSKSPATAPLDESTPSQGGVIEESHYDAIGNDGNGFHGDKSLVSSLPTHNPLLMGCRSVYSCYERLAHLDEGTYGVVWKARDCATDEIVALKQIKFDEALTHEGFPIAAMREIGVLLALSHECIVTVREMVVGDAFDKVFMVMEYMDMDLQEAMKRTGQAPFPQSELKHMLYQILSATQHIHEKWYLHRDLKTSNILVQKQTGKVALCDFGLARKYQMPLKAMTQMVITLWYRPPELLFGETVYGPEVDMWSIGCIFGEIIKKKAMLQGRGELDQIDKIFKLLGVPDDKSWPGFSSLPNSRTFRWKSKEGSKLSKEFPVGSFSGAGQSFLDSNGFDLLQRLLTMNPKNRITATEAINHPYFREGIERKAPSFIL